MTIRHLRIFLEVCRTGSATRAAETLHMTQPAVSRALREMEEYYGVRLFDRFRRRLAVTDAGRGLYGQALRIVDSFDSLERSLRDGDAAGLLRVGAGVTIGNFLLPAAAKEFQAGHPAIRLQVLVARGEALRSALLENRLDLALLEMPVRDAELTAEPFASDRMVLVTPPGHPLLSQAEVSLADLSRVPLLLREEGSAVRSALDGIFAARGLVPQPLWESSSTQALLRAVNAGLGVSVLPESLAADFLRAGLVGTREISGEAFRRQYYLVHHREKYLTGAAKDFLAICRKAGAARKPSFPGGGAEAGG